MTKSGQANCYVQQRNNKKQLVLSVSWSQLAVNSKLLYDDAGGRWILNRSLHIVQIICQGNNREENRQHTHQRNYTLETIRAV